VAKSLPPSLSSIKSEFRELCDELGGPADIGVAIDNRYMEHCCQEFPLERLLPILLLFQSDEIIARRHWPWAAFAADQYVFEKKERAKYSDEPTPKEVVELLQQIRQAARELSSGLLQLQTFSNRLFDPSAPTRRAHLAWLDEFISQAIAGKLSDDLDENAGTLAINHFKKLEFLKQLLAIQRAAKAAMPRIDKSLLQRERSQSDPALPNLVYRCSLIWKSMTGRKPSAEKVHRSIRHKGPSEPDFVVFIRKLANAAGHRLPSRHQVFTSLQKMRP
jgi:hypothetical protein